MPTALWWRRWTPSRPGEAWWMWCECAPALECDLLGDPSLHSAFASTATGVSAARQQAQFKSHPGQFSLTPERERPAPDGPPTTTANARKGSAPCSAGLPRPRTPARFSACKSSRWRNFSPPTAVPQRPALLREFQRGCLYTTPSGTGSTRGGPQRGPPPIRRGPQLAPNPLVKLVFSTGEQPAFRTTTSGKK